MLLLWSRAALYCSKNRHSWLQSEDELFLSPFVLSKCSHQKLGLIIHLLLLYESRQPLYAWTDLCVEDDIFIVLDVEEASVESVLKKSKEHAVTCILFN